MTLFLILVISNIVCNLCNQIQKGLKIPRSLSLFFVLTVISVIVFTIFILVLPPYIKEFNEILVEENKVKGCVSEVFVKANIKGGKLFWEGYSDALITKGLLAFLISGLNEFTPYEVVDIDKKFIEDTGLKASLTPSRSNGFLNILLKMQSQANEF